MVFIMIVMKKSIFTSLLFATSLAVSSVFGAEGAKSTKDLIKVDCPTCCQGENCEQKDKPVDAPTDESNKTEHKK